jgi:carbohydrate kinase (thermoresistant glucokinase family)
MHLKFLSKLSRTLESANLMILIVAGVSGSGKTTVGAMLAGRLHWPFADADDFHPAANIEKMRSGIPLTDEDRQPWLRAIAAWMDEHIAGDEPAVMTCSALKRSYRDTLLGGRRRSGSIRSIHGGRNRSISSSRPTRGGCRSSVPGGIPTQRADEQTEKCVAQRWELSYSDR